MKYKKTAIIFGITGQDGAYLSHFLLQKGYKVIGTTRNKTKKNLFRLNKLKITQKIIIFKGEATNLKFCRKVLNLKIVPKNPQKFFFKNYKNAIIRFLFNNTTKQEDIEPAVRKAGNIIRYAVENFINYLKKQKICI